MKIPLRPGPRGIFLLYRWEFHPHSFPSTTFTFLYTFKRSNTCRFNAGFHNFAVSFRMRKLQAYFLSTLSLGLIVIDSCVYHDFPQTVCREEISFANDVRPIILTKCAVSGCHNGDMGPDLNWTDFAQFHKRAESGLVKYRVTNRIMPPSFTQAGPLSQDQIDMIACWTDQGARNN